jgi:hypothetical protein
MSVDQANDLAAVISGGAVGGGWRARRSPVDTPGTARAGGRPRPSRPSTCSRPVASSRRRHRRTSRPSPSPAPLVARPDDLVHDARQHRPDVQAAEGLRRTRGHRSSTSDASIVVVEVHRLASLAVGQRHRAIRHGLTQPFIQGTGRCRPSGRPDLPRPTPSRHARTRTSARWVNFGNIGGAAGQNVKQAGGFFQGIGSGVGRLVGGFFGEGAAQTGLTSVRPSAPAPVAAQLCANARGHPQFSRPPTRRWAATVSGTAVHGGVRAE